MRPVLVISVVLAAGLTAAAGTVDDPFAFFRPSVEVSAADRARLDGGEALVRVLPADDGHVAVFAAIRTTASPAALFAWTREIAALKRGPLVLGVGRFGNPPTLADLQGLSLDAGELETLRRCRIGDCGLKLAADEITAVRRAIAVSPASWESAVQETFRGILLDRVLHHRAQGLLSLPPYADKGHGLSVGEAFSSIVARSPYLVRAFPDAVNTLQTPAHASDGHDGFYYWSRERYGAGRTVVTVTYVRLLHEHTATVRALTISTQLFASHYFNGGVGLTAVLCGDSRERCYLAYVNRTQTDVLGGLFGGLKRAIVEQRIESDTPAMLRTINARIESGYPSADTERAGSAPADSSD